MQLPLPRLYATASNAGLSSSGGGIRTRDLRVMSPTSYLTAPPRVATNKCSALRLRASRGRKCLNGGQNLGIWRIVARIFGQVDVEDVVARGHHEHAAELGRMPHG